MLQWQSHIIVSPSYYVRSANLFGQLRAVVQTATTACEQTAVESLQVSGCLLGELPMLPRWLEYACAVTAVSDQL